MNLINFVDEFNKFIESFNDLKFRQWIWNVNELEKFIKPWFKFWNSKNEFDKFIKQMVQNPKNKFKSLKDL